MSSWEPWLVEGGQLKYRGIVEAIEADLRAGRIQPGDRLPPQRTIAEVLGVDLTTVTRAFNEARRRGLVEANAGRGTFIRRRIDDGRILGHGRAAGRRPQHEHSAATGRGQPQTPHPRDHRQSSLRGAWHVEPALSGEHGQRLRSCRRGSVAWPPDRSGKAVINRSGQRRAERALRNL